MDQIPDRLVIAGTVDDRVRKPRLVVVPRWTVLEPWVYLVALGFSELVSDLWQPLVGVWLHALLATVLILRGSQLTGTREGHFCIALSIMPLVRIVSFAISPTFASGVWFYVAAEMPFLGAALAGARVLDLKWNDIGICRPRSWLLSAVVLVTGVGEGWLEAQIIHPAALASGLSPHQVLLPALLLIVSTGIVEEIVFRGLIQLMSTRLLGTIAGVVYTSLGWALLHIGWLSVIDVFYVCAIGLIWGWFRHVNRSVLDIGVAHGLANVMLFLIVPYLRL